MRTNLVIRAGADTPGKLEAAARGRFQEARLLQAQGHWLGAVYLYGYVIEMTLKSAYYRVIGLTSATLIDYRHHRKPAEVAIADLPDLPRHQIGKQPAGHHLVGWATLLHDTRSRPGFQAMDQKLADLMHQHVNQAFACWAEFLRYHANRPYESELRIMFEAARWYRRNASRLWR